MKWPDGGYESEMADGELGFKETSGTGPLTKNFNNPAVCDLDRSTDQRRSMSQSQRLCRW